LDLPGKNFRIRTGCGDQKEFNNRYQFSQDDGYQQGVKKKSKLFGKNGGRVLRSYLKMFAWTQQAVKGLISSMAAMNTTKQIELPPMVHQ